MGLFFASHEWMVAMLVNGLLLQYHPSLSCGGAEDSEKGAEDSEVQRKASCESSVLSTAVAVA